MNALARLIAVALLAGLATLPADRPAFAETPPPAQGYVLIEEIGSGISFNNIWNPAPLDTTYTGVLSSVTLGSSPLPYVQANAVSGVHADAWADGILTYFVGVVGPSSEISVPIDFSGSYNLSGSATPDGGVYTQVQWNIISRPDQVFGFCAYDPTPAASCSLGSGLFSGTVHALSGGASYVTVQLGAHTEIVRGSTASAYIDPYFFIDPAWAAQNPGYSLIFSPGIGNGLTAPGPQPSAFGSVALGLLCLASARRKLKNGLRS